MEFRLAQLVHAALTSQCTLGREHDGDDILNSERLRTSHSDRFRGIPHFLRDTRARNFIGRLAATAVLAEHTIHRWRIATWRADLSSRLLCFGSDPNE